MAYRINYLDGDTVNDTQKVVTSTWTNNTNDLVVSTNNTSSTQASFTAATSSGAHYIEVYNTGISSASAAVQFAVAYGHKAGSGSLDFTNDTGAKGNSPSRNIYNQYRQLVFGDETKNFSFPSTGTDAFTPDDIYVININRSRYKNNLKTSTLNLTLCVTQSADAANGQFLILTDDSVTSTGSAEMTNVGRQFNLVSGSNGVRLGDSNVQVAGSGSYGLFYPDAGFIILNPAALKQTLTGSATTDSPVISGSLSPGINANTADNNPQKLLGAISGGGSFIVDSEEKISSKYYFTRIKNSEFNFTTNPSFIDGSGNLRYSTMENNPKVYITTVGLYNDTNDLIAVAKLSQPIAKDFSKEALIRVKLDY